MPVTPAPAALPPRRSGAPVCERGGISVRAVRLADDPEFVEHVAELRSMAFGEGEPWNYGLDLQDRQAIQMVAFDASGPVGALRLCLGDELLAQAGFEGFYMNTGWELDPRSEAFFGTALEYGRFWVVRGHPRTRGIIDALLTSIGAFSSAHPRYQSVFGTVALLDHTPESCRLVVDYLRRYHLPDVRWVRPRRPFEPDTSAPPPPASSLPPRRRAFRLLVQQQRKADPDHPLPALLHLYLRQGAQMLGDVAWDTSGRKLLIPLYVSMATFQDFVARLRGHSGASSPSAEPGPEPDLAGRPWSSDDELL
ncbi:uncharacterized protein SOCE26_037400 [Sorangium cellulosum]|uniref:N-acetyltransferase domain-containing protein n=1 Tax=Sorangium cellulosum TaxID=56 RepID=A0A2L0ESR3_SORCE|nr:hypothetical protein [Sorangium cellulosum]AUX42310.1 uncharacterized protein SOCE26_037400 [Sorangium cellulosum]